MRAVSLYVAADCADIWHTLQTRENVYQTLLHTVSRKHVIQPGNRSKTLGLSLNVPQVSNTPSTITPPPATQRHATPRHTITPRNAIPLPPPPPQRHTIGWADCMVAERDQGAATSENTCK